MISFDPRPLTAPINPAAAREFTQRLRAEGRLPSGFAGGTIVAGVMIAIFVIGFALFGGFFAFIFGAVFTQDAGLAAILPTLFLVLVVGGVATIVIVSLVNGGKASAARRFRLDTFARANGMSYVPSIPSPHLPGMIFGQGSSREASDLVRGDLPRFVEFANYRYTTGSGKNRTTHRWGYVAVRLDVPLPHIVLDAIGNNGLFGSNLPAAFDKDQRLSLEGDFDRYFSLYCPSGYETDALYLFTPDIMARFIDNAAALDVEIVDDWLFLYAKRDLSTLDPATWAWLFTAVSALLDKLAQWARWRDDRLAAMTAAAATDSVASGIPGAATGPTPVVTPPPLPARPIGVAPPGRRLTRRFSWVPFVIIGAFVLWWLFGQLGGLSLVFGTLLSR